MRKGGQKAHTQAASVQGTMAGMRSAGRASESSQEQERRNPNASL